MTVCVRIGFATLVLAAAAASRAGAQSDDNTFAIGGNVSVRGAPAADASGTKGVGLLWRIGHSETGWGFKYGFNWFSTDIEAPVGGSPTALGEVKVRPILVGYGYTRVVGPTSISANLLGGPAFTSFTLTRSAPDMYRERLGARSLDVQVGNTFVLKPEVSVWFDVSPKVGVNVSAGYMIARPTLTISNSIGEQARRFRADMVVLKMGAVYKVF